MYYPYGVEDNIPYIIWAADDVIVEVSEYSALIKGFIQQADTEFIMGIRDINDDAQWEAYLEELNSYGLEDYIDLLYEYYRLEK